MPISGRSSIVFPSRLTDDLIFPRFPRFVPRVAARCRRKLAAQLAARRGDLQARHRWRNNCLNPKRPWRHRPVTRGTRVNGPVHIRTGYMPST